MSATKKLCINAMGIALFVTLTLCLQVPVFENYYLCLGYVAMAFYLYYFGTASGTLIGTLGVILYCIITNGLRGMPGWAVGNIIIGIICGLFCRIAKKQKRQWTKQILMAIAVMISVALGILIAKSLVEVFLYSLPFALRIANNIYAFVADIIVLLFEFGLSIACEKVMMPFIEGM